LKPENYKPGQGRAAACCIALVILQPLLFFRRVIINPTAHIPFDIEGFHLPLISYIAQCVRHGVAPLWDPYQHCGMPIHGDMQAQLFYPFTWLAILAGNHSQGRDLYYWVEWLDPLHMMLAGLFTLLLLRRLRIGWPAALLGASIYQLGGYFASQAQHLGAICTGAWLPLGILAVFELSERPRPRWIGIFALAIAMSLLSGFAAAAAVVAGAVLLVTAALLARREASPRALPALGAGFALAAAICSAQLIPLWRLSHASMASLRGNWYVEGGGLPLETLVSLIAPDHYHIFEWAAGYHLPYDFTFLYAYCGIAAVILCLLALFVQGNRGRMFLALTVASAFWMLGQHTPVYRVLFMRLPSFVRGALYAEFALMAFCFFAAVTAACVLDRIGGRLPRAALWAIVLLSSYDLIRTGSHRPMNTAEGGYKAEDSEYQSAGANRFLEKVRSLVHQTSPLERIDYMDGGFPQGIRGSEMIRIPTPDGDNPFILRRMLYLRRLFSNRNYWERQLPVHDIASPLLSMLNVGWLAARSPVAPADAVRAGLQLEDHVDGLYLYRRPQPLPRFFLVHRIRRSKGEDASFRMLSSALSAGAFQPAEEAIVEGIPADRDGLADGDVKVTLYSANRIHLRVTTGGPAYLVSSEIMYDGWQATVNGRAREILMTNGAFRGLPLAAGVNDVSMEYHPPGFALLLLLSVVALIVTGAAVAAGPRPEAPPVLAWARAGTRRARLVWAALITQRREEARWIALLMLATALFYWKILFTNQFSLLTESEGVTQAYSWLTYWISSIRHGALPLWDPYTLAGHSFAGEMQTAVFYPLHLLLALFPLDRNGLLSPFLYHVWIAFTHFLGACFMFALIRELGLSRFAAFVAGICFSMGGFVARMGWPHMLESSIWLPLIFLFLLRALRAARNRTALRNAAFAGLLLGLSILAGGLHVVLMQVLAIVAAAGYWAFLNRAAARRAAVVVGVIALAGFAAGAVQLLPSLEYSCGAVRFLGRSGALPASEKIPYDFLTDEMWPQGVAAMVVPFAYGGNIGGGEVDNPYLGVFPLLLAAAGIWRCWQNRWVRFFAVLAALAFLYSFGPFSPLHGVLYVLVPKLWMAREASRIVYLTDFSLAILTAFGMEALFSGDADPSVWPNWNRALAGVSIACALALFVPAVFVGPEVNPWIALSLVLIPVSGGLFRYAQRGSSRVVCLAIVALVMFDLGAFDWTARNKLETARTGIDHLTRLVSCRRVAQIFKWPTEPFRVEVEGDAPPNIGDAFGVQTISPAGATVPADYLRLAGDANLLNVRFRVAPASARQPGALYEDAAWKIYENPGALPRAWLVHQVFVETSAERAWQRVKSAGFDARRTAVVDGEAPVEPLAAGVDEGVQVSSFAPDRIEMEVRAESQALLVLSEMFDPGWRAKVNGRRVPTYRTDSGLRGVVVPKGQDHIVMEYAPAPVYAGGAWTVTSFLLGAALLMAARRGRDAE
jgi:hypothetical protein